MTIRPQIAVWALVIGSVMQIDVMAQARGGQQIFGDVDKVLQEKSAIGVVQPAGMALESVVDPEKYYVGPSDLFAVNIWISPPISLTLAVTPEGTLVIPSVGEVRVADLLLARAKERIINAVRKKYVAGQVSATLVHPRSIVVSVVGNVMNPGLYTLSSVDRAHKAIEEANRPLRMQTQHEVEDVARRMSIRNILLRRKDGSEQRVDIRKFLATKEDQWNPYLREGDVLVVPRRNLTKNVFAVYGEVNSPGRYEFADGDRILDAIEIAYGFTRSARLDSIEFSRLSPDGVSMQRNNFSFEHLQDGKVENLLLQPGDRLVIKPKVELREDYTVSIVGEVVYPGTYPITRKSTRLSEVIRQAGGFTEFASLEMSTLNRRSIDPTEIELERLLSLRGGVSSEDSSYYFAETELRLQKEVVNIDFVKLFTEQDTTQDVTLQMDDYIMVPSLRRTVFVFGQIVSPGHIPYVPGRGAQYYIQKAGGFTERAREGDLKIVKAKSKQWLSPNETTIEAGDYVWVPKEPDRPFIYYTTIISQVATVLSAIVGIAVVINTVK